MCLCDHCYGFGLSLSVLCYATCHFTNWTDFHVELKNLSQGYLTHNRLPVQSLISVKSCLILHVRIPTILHNIIHNQQLDVFRDLFLMWLISGNHKYIDVQCLENCQPSSSAFPSTCTDLSLANTSPLVSPLGLPPLSLSPYLVSPLSLREVTTKNCRPPTFPTVTFTQSTFSCLSSLPQGFVHVGLTIHIKKLKQRKPQPSLITAHLVNKLLVETSFVVAIWYH